MGGPTHTATNADPLKEEHKLAGNAGAFPLKIPAACRRKAKEERFQVSIPECVLLFYNTGLIHSPFIP